jgi:Cft2 family RNA processing exonuclease
LPDLLRETGAAAVYANAEIGPYPERRDREAASAVEAAGSRLRLFPDALLVEPDALATGAGDPYTVYTPFSRKWMEAAAIIRSESSTTTPSAASPCECSRPRKAGPGGNRIPSPMASRPVLLEPRPEGLYAPALEAWIDPAAPVPRALLSHAHADHAVGGHGEILATPETAALYRLRHPGWTGTARTLSYGEPMESSGVTLRLVPAGHVLGSAQIHLATDGDSVLYTGDFKRRRGRTAAPAETPAARTLLIETTFGLPVFRFPDTPELEERLVAACREAIADGEIPVVLAYSLGKSQEAAAILAEAGIPTVLHGAAWKLLPAYAAAGVALPDTLTRPYETGPPSPGEALVTPPSTVRTPMVRAIKRRRVIYLSGWALREAARAEHDADVRIPMSDHADFDALLAHVRDVAPETVVTFHGFAQDFARILAREGVDARTLAGREERPARDEDA